MAIPEAAVSPFGPELPNPKDSPNSFLQSLQVDLDELHRAVSVISELGTRSDTGLDLTELQAQVDQLAEDVSDLQSQISDATIPSTFTGISLIDATCHIIDDVDATKRARFECEDISPSTEVVWRFPSRFNTGGTFVSSDVAEEIYTNWLFKARVGIGPNLGLFGIERQLHIDSYGPGGGILLDDITTSNPTTQVITHRANWASPWARAYGFSNAIGQSVGEYGAMAGGQALGYAYVGHGYGGLTPWVGPTGGTDNGAAFLMIRRPPRSTLYQPLIIDPAFANNITQLVVQSSRGGNTVNWAEFRNANEDVKLAVNEFGILEGPDPNVPNDPFTFWSIAEGGGAGVDVSSFGFGVRSTVTTESAHHTRWTDKAGSHIMMLGKGGTLYKGPSTADNQYVGSRDVDPTWYEDHYFDKDIFVSGFIYGDSGASSMEMHSTTVDGAASVAFSLVDDVARTTGHAFLLTNSADGKEAMRISWHGKMSLGYLPSISPDAISLPMLSFKTDDTASGVFTGAGLLASIKHSNAVITQTTMGGVIGSSTVNTTTALNTDFVFGTLGEAFSNTDSAGCTGKVLAGVVGIVSDADTTLVPTDIDGGVSYGRDSVKGNWDHVSTFWADAMINAAGAAPTNLPLIASAYRGTVPENTTGECWMLYGDLYEYYYTSKHKNYQKYGAPMASSVAGGIRVPWPRHGSRRTHMFFIPGDKADAGASVEGDVMFHDGTGADDAGLYQYVSGAWVELAGGGAGGGDSFLEWAGL
jgi:hypothetical protein